MTLCLVIKALALWKFGKMARCVVLSIHLSKNRIKEGSKVIQTITPMITPFAITIPRSRPKANVIKHNAANPATVVMELPTTDLNVLLIACAIARSLSLSKRTLFA